MKLKIYIVLLLIILITSCKKKETKPAETTPPNYTNFKVLSVTLSAMPFLDNSSSNWDPFDGPDVFYNVETASGSVLFNGSASRYSDISASSLPLNWDFTPAYQITNIYVALNFTIYDYDTIDPNDEIGYVSFTMGDYKSNYPKTITKTNNGVTIKLTGEWY